MSRLFLLVASLAAVPGLAAPKKPGATPAETLPVPTSYVAVDLVDEDAPAAVRRQVEEHLDGRLTLLVNNAGASWRSTFGDGIWGHG